MASYKPNVLTNEIQETNSTKAEYTLYVNDLPGELNEQGLLQIFSHYGNIIGHFYRANTSWAFITYGTRVEADNAIRDLHNVPPLRLKVSYAKPKIFSNNHPTQAVANNAEQYERPSIANDYESQNILITQAKGRGRPMEIFKYTKPNPGLPTYTYTSNDDLLYPYPSDARTFNPYDSTEPYGNTNTLWTRGEVTITQDGKRHVSLGRGYTLYEIPDLDPEIQNHISKIQEKRSSGLYEYGKDILQNEIGKCQRCAKIAKFNCQTCGSFYCSKNCQEADWPLHRVQCRAIPELVPCVNSMHLSSSGNGEQTTSKHTTVQLPLRRPKKMEETETSSPKCEINNVLKNRDSTDLSTANYNGCNEIIHVPQNKINAQSNKNGINNRVEIENKQDQAKAVEKENVQIKKPFDTQSNHSQASRPGSDRIVNDRKSESFENKKRHNFKVDDVTKIEEDIAFSKKTFLQRNEFTQVRIIVKEGCEYWVQKVEDTESIVKLMTDLQDDAVKGQKLKPVVGNTFAVQYENVWHRALVTSLNPLTVHYVDYGNNEIVETDDFREINKYNNIPRFCAKIRLSDRANEKYKDLKYEDTISVKMLSCDSNGVINVEVQNENNVQSINNTSVLNTSKSSNTDKLAVSLQPPTPDKSSGSANNLINIVNVVPFQDSGILEIHVQLNSNTYSVTLLPNSAIFDYEKLLDALQTECKQELTKTPNHKPQIKDIICGQRSDGDWLRGYVLSLESPLKMAIIDEARLMPVVNTVPCSEKFLKIPSFGATCEIINAKTTFKPTEQYEFKVMTRKAQDEVEVEISVKDERFKAILKPWVPKPEQKGLQYTELKSGSEVCITAYRSHVHLFARSLETEDVEHFNRVMQCVAKCAQTASPLKEPPVIGQMVISQYVDDNYYRAIVTKVQNDEVTISYVDYGNTEITKVKNLKVLSDDLKQLRSCTSKILLKDVPSDVPMTKEVSDYFSSIVGTEVPLTCTFDGVPSKDGVCLKSHSGENINKTISEMLSPTWKKTGEQDTTCYMLNDISVASLGKVGDVDDVLVLYSIQDAYKYAMCAIDFDLMTHVFQTMQKAVTEYCERTDYYIPRDKELCLVRYEDGWYRAACINRSETPTTSTIFFIDYGNVESVSHKDIRLMPKDFTTPNALASICNIVNIAPVQSNGMYSPEVEKRITELVVANEHIKIKIVQCDEDTGIYSVELPAVRAKLIEEGLVSS